MCNNMDTKSPLKIPIKDSEKIKLVQSKNMINRDVWDPETEKCVDVLLVAPENKINRIETIQEIKKIVGEYPNISARLTPLEGIKGLDNQDFIIEVKIYED
jgi:hypothetical protein